MIALGVPELFFVRAIHPYPVNMCFSWIRMKAGTLTHTHTQRERHTQTKTHTHTHTDTHFSH